jgi:ammonia channel protein AmtB
LIYYPMAHMVWGKGGMLNAFLGGSIPTLDFAGGTVVHITSGVSGVDLRHCHGQTSWLSDRTDAAPQPGTELHRRLPTLVRLVRL